MARAPDWKKVGAGSPLRGYLDQLATDKELRGKLALDKLEAGAVLSMSHNWLGVSPHIHQEIYIRDCYPALLKALDEYMSLRQKSTGVSLVLGTPGCGKSTSGAVYTSIKLVDGRPVLLEFCDFDSQSHTFILMVPEGTDRIEAQWGSDFAAAVEAVNCLIGPELPKPLHVVDGGLSQIPHTRLSPSAVDVVYFASPREDFSRLRSKGLLKVALYMPLQPLEEMLDMKNKLRQFQVSAAERQADDQDVAAWYNIVGGIPRACLLERRDGTTLPTWTEAARVKVQDLVSEGWLFAVSNELLPAGSDTVFHWNVLPRTTAPASNSPTDPALRAFDLAVASGHWFETLAEMLLCAGGSFQCRILAKQGESPGPCFTLNLDTAQGTAVWTDLKHAASLVGSCPGAYLLPQAHNEKAIDGLRSAAILLQMTMAKSHTLLKAPLDSLVNELDTNNLVQPALEQLRKKISWQVTSQAVTLDKPMLFWVLPAARYNTMYTTCRSYLTASGTVAESQEGPVLQAALKIDLMGLAQEATNPDQAGDIMQRLVSMLPASASNSEFVAC
ncbi:hypothetical protein WJX73_000233 [Symbiochloris irregularis]|uniref:Uncharacterized protein n=1 Tax=Symbiochloris irregularis TaxID=706552 RepID=A0AAW1P124_9CHLO